MQKPLVVVASLVIAVPALMGAQTPVTVPPPKPKVVAKPEEKPSLIGRVFGRKSKGGEASNPEAPADTKKPETSKKPPETAAPKAEEKPKVKTTETASEKPKRRARVTKAEPKEEAKPAPKTEKEAKPTPKTEEKPVTKEEPKEEAKPAPTEEPKTAAAPKPEAEEKTQASTKKTSGKKGTTAAKPAATKVDTSHMDDGAKFRVTKAAAQEDPAIKELKAKADGAISESEAHSATVAYNRALFRKIRAIEPSLDSYVDQMESAMMKRLNAEKKSE